MPIYILLSIFIILQLLDTYTTKRNLLDKGGKEHWPPMKYLIDKFGFWRAIISGKVLAVIVVSMASLYIMNINSTSSIYFLLGINLWYMGVLSFNRFKKVRNLFGFN